MVNPSIFTNRSFIIIWIGNAISELGGAFGTFCNSVLVYQLTGSTMALGSMWLLYFIPSLILQLFIGPVIDSYSRKKMMIYSQCSRGFIFLLPLIIYITGNLQSWHIYIVQLMIGLITPIFTPANQSIIPTIVLKPHLSKANAYIDGTVRLMTFIAPLVAGIFVESFGIILTLSFIILLLLTSGMMLFFIEESYSPNHVRQSWMNQFTEGISYYFKQRVITWLGFFLAFVQFGVGVTMVITLPYITKELSGSFAQYGYFLAGFPLGYVIGSLLVGKITNKSRRLIMLGALSIGGFTYILLGITTSLYLAFLIEGIAGVALAIFNIHNITICQQYVPNELLGKVTSVRLFIIRASMPVGVLIGGFLGEIWGVRQLYICIGFIICITSILGLTLPYFSFIDTKNTGENTSV